MGRRPLCRRDPLDSHQVLARAQASCHRCRGRHQLCDSSQLRPRGELWRRELEQQPSGVAERARCALSLLTPAIISRADSLFWHRRRKRSIRGTFAPEKCATAVVLLLLARKLLLNNAARTAHALLQKRPFFLSSRIILQYLPVATLHGRCGLTQRCSAGAAQFSPATEHDCQWHPPGPLPAATPRELLSLAQAEIGYALPDNRIHRGSFARRDCWPFLAAQMPLPCYEMRETGTSTCTVQDA